MKAEYLTSTLGALGRPSKQAVAEQLAQKGLTRVEKDADLCIGYQAIESAQEVAREGFGEKICGFLAGANIAFLNHLACFIQNPVVARAISRSKPIVSLCSLKILLPLPRPVLSFFTTGLLSLAPRAR